MKKNAHGDVIYRYACGDLYKGELKDGTSSGHGVYLHKVGVVYEGQ